MNRNDRNAFNRVAKRIKDQAAQTGKPVTMETAQRELARHLTKADNRKNK